MADDPAENPDQGSGLISSSGETLATTEHHNSRWRSCSPVPMAEISRPKERDLHATPQDFIRYATP